MDPRKPLESQQVIKSVNIFLEHNQCKNKENNQTGKNVLYLYFSSKLFSLC